MEPHLAFTTGGIVGALMKVGLDVTIITDNEGNYTNQFLVSDGGRKYRVTVAEEVHQIDEGPQP